MITSPKAIATPTWPSWCVRASTTTAPALRRPARTCRSPRRPARGCGSAATAPRSGEHREWLGHHVGLHRLDDRAVHAVGSLVGELDRHVLEAGLRETALV